MNKRQKREDKAFRSFKNGHPCNMTCCEKSAPINLAHEKHRLGKEVDYEDFYGYVCYNCDKKCKCDL